MGVFLCVYTSPALAGPSGIRAGWGIEINDRFEAERSPSSAVASSGGRAATLTLLSPIYSSIYLVQSISRLLLSSSSYNPASLPGSRFRLVKLLGSLDPHCT